MALYVEAMDLALVVGDMATLATCLEGVASVAAFQGQAARAARLFSAVAALRHIRNMPLPPADRSTYDCTLDSARIALGDDAFAAAWAAGQMLPLEQVIVEAQAGTL
jgi:hypothetical protein